MVRCSNSLVGVLNFLTFLLSIPILGAGIWLSTRGTSECERFLEKPVIALGVFLMVVSLAGLIGACCGVTWLLWIYLFVMFLLIVLVFCFTIFAFVVTNKGAGQVVSGRGFKEYRLGDYSNWLQKRVTNTKNWNKIKSCLVDGKVCQTLQAKKEALALFNQENLSSIQSGCCKPPIECGLSYVSPTEWTGISNSTNSDCTTWSNSANALCYNCNSCKKVAVVNIIFLIILIIVYSIGCCAFRNNRAEKAHSDPRWRP
ncbi:unnamed protein product [Spirodela intermedia]|uniref:Uncharacterized protein n=1 Tax=Spirodela intermedia TaxID=51605 RepID=A0A7I8IWA5_SPIIN|nr:unnamed protein product [Spirodela intermedia]CAA6662267.1 unnamed protein product [Spirodela intermedia]